MATPPPYVKRVILTGNFRFQLSALRKKPILYVEEERTIKRYGPFYDEIKVKCWVRATAEQAFKLQQIHEK